MPAIGDPAPAFSLPSTSGKDVSLSALRGKRVVLYFYPKDDTPGCTREACGFRDNMARLSGHGAVVLGISRDSIAAHEKFRKKYGLPFELLSDPGASVGKAYGAFGKKMMYGKPVVGTIRSTFLIDEKGRLARIWSPVKVDGHVDAVLRALAGDEAEPASQPAARKSSTRPTARESVTKPALPARRAKTTGDRSRANPRSARSRTRGAVRGDGSNS